MGESKPKTSEKHKVLQRSMNYGWMLFISLPIFVDFVALLSGAICSWGLIVDKGTDAKGHLVHTSEKHTSDLYFKLWEWKQLENNG